MKFCNQDISKTITARSFKLGQRSNYLMKIKKESLYFWGLLLSFKLGQLIEDTEKTTW